MDKKIYQAPNMDVIQLKTKGNVLFEGSGSTPGYGGSGDGIDE